MAQKIQIKRGGIGNFLNSTPTTDIGELVLATGSISGLESTLLVGTGSTATELTLPYARIESTGKAALSASLGNNKHLKGLLIHDTNKLFRYDGSDFQELSISAGSFDGTLAVGSGGTGQTSLDDIVGDSEIIVANGTNTVIGGNVTLSLGGGVVTGSSQIAINSTSGTLTTLGTVTTGNVDAILPAGTVSGSSQVAINSTSGTLTTLGTVTSGNVDAILPAGTVSGSSQVDINSTSGTLTTLGTVTSGNVDAILPAGTVSSSAQIDTTGNLPAGVVSGSSQIDINSTSGTLTTLGTVTAGNVDAILPAGIISSSAQIDEAFNQDNVVSGSGVSNQVAVFNGGNSISGSGEFTWDGSTLTVAGDLSVTGTTTTVDSTNVQIGDRILSLNTANAAGDAGIEVHDTDGNQTGSLLWDTDGNYWKGGVESSEKRIVTFNAANPTNNAFIHTNGSDEVVAIAASAGAILQRNAANNAFVVSNVLDGGTF